MEQQTDSCRSLSERTNQRNIGGELKYPNLQKVVFCLMSLPVANSPVERLFSKLKLIKTESRNSLKRKSLVGLLNAKEGLAVLQKSAHQLNLQEHPEVLKLVRSVKSNATDVETPEIITM